MHHHDQATKRSEHSQQPHLSFRMPSFTMPLLLFGALPFILFYIPTLIEPYALWNPKVLNSRDTSDGRITAWCNMGWWKNTDIFPEAAEALAGKLLRLAQEGGYQGGGNVLDIGHGAGESLLLHLSQENPPGQLHALTSLSSDTAVSKALVESVYPDTSTRVQFYTFSAQFRPGKDVGHPLDPMRGFLGEQSSQRFFEEDQSTERKELADEPPEDKPQSSSKYDLVYILDSIYHYPPSIPSFLASLRSALHSSSLVVYTDILPPPDLSKINAYLLSRLLSVPMPNLTSRPRNLEEYKAQLGSQGWEDVAVEDWSDGVWNGFSNALKTRGGMWSLVGRAIKVAEENGWKFIGVRARKGGNVQIEA
ncbi:hypothetical protein J008_06959 [Cryptococcus neoformans]|nr:hypothetical protein C367_06925 [Cryptococcus neoformans var. grubii Ze90-1]OXH21184.1 hypothetical protein J008_06959 [Cryptococcus neoformans var. grubii]